MQYIQLGQSGLRVSRFVFGTLTFAGTQGFEAIGSAAGAEARRQVDLALEAGVNMIDTANLYSRGDSEIVVGEALAGRRDQMLIATKVGFPMGDGQNDRGSSRAHLVDQVEKSLQRLKTDRIDLYFIHLWDGLTPVEETVAAMTDLIRAGKVRYWGVSNYNAWHLTKTVMAARAMGAIAPVCQQIYYTAEGREAEYELLPAAQDLGVSSMIWSPLGQGVLTGKVRRGQAAPDGSRQSANWPEPWVMSQDRLFDVVDVLEAVAGEIGATISQVALAWLAGRPDVGPIVVGARTDAQLSENLAAADIALSEEQAERIEAAARPAPLYPFWHRAMHALARATPDEAACLRGHRRTLGLDG